MSLSSLAPSFWFLQESVTIGQFHFIGCLELWCAADELGKLWSVEYELIEKAFEVKVSEPGGEHPWAGVGVRFPAGN
jgi:hypothetical protein